MKKKRSYTTLVLTACIWLLACWSVTSAAAKPNIIFILTDDQRYDAMGFMGHYPFLKTPNLDRIRNEGTHLKNAFATLSMCAPSRASFLTGTYPHVHGVNTNVEQREYNPDKTPSFPMVLQAAGYKTAFMGKWHMDHSTSPRRGFDHWISFAGQGKYHGNKLNIDGKSVQNPGYITDELNKYALNFIRSQSENPFCLYLSHKAVHQPWDAAPRHKELYKGEVVPHQDNFKDNLADKPSWQKVSRSRDKLYRLRYNDSYSAPKRVSPKPYSKENGAHPGTKEYLRCIAAVDDGIGLIYDLLEEKGILDNTAIIFAGDNGYMLGEHGRGDKRVHYNESMRIPLVMRLPKGMAHKKTVDSIVLNIDVAPTILDIAGVEAPEVMQGRSVLSLFDSKQAVPWREDFLFTYWRDLIPTLPRILAVRDHRYVYSTYPDIDDIDELYDLQNDPYEMRNLAVSPEHKGLVATMEKKLNRLKADTGYKKVVPRPRPEPDWGVETGLLCDVSFDDKGQARDRSKLALGLKQNGGATAQGLGAKALRLDGSNHIELDWDADVTPEKGSYVIEAMVKTEQGGVIAAQGNDYRGFILYIDDGCPGFVTKESGHRLQFMDSQRSFKGEWVHVLAQVRNYHNEMSLWVNGQLVVKEKIMWPLHVMHKGIGGLVVGKDLSGKIDPKEISKAPFVGDIQYVRVHRSVNVRPILDAAAKYGLAGNMGTPRSPQGL